METNSDVGDGKDPTDPGNVTDGANEPGVKDIANSPQKPKRFGGRQLKYRIIKTGCLVMTWVCIGLFTEMSGPTFKDLELRLNLPSVEATEAVSRATSGRSLGFLAGAVIGGVLVDRFKKKGDLLIGLGVCCEAAVTIGVPWMTTWITMWLLMFSQGIFEAIINIAGQKIILLLWGDNSAGPMHLTHFGFGMGSFLNPLIAQPFLATRVVTNNTVLEATTSNAEQNLTFQDTGNDTQTVTLVGSRIEYAYLIGALIATISSSSFFWFQYKGVPHGAYVGDLVEKDPGVKGCKRYINLIDPATCAGGKRLAGFLLFILLFFHFFQAVAGQEIYSKFIRNFGLDQLGMSSSEATYLNSSFWISFSVGRFLGFVVALFVPIRFLIVIECFAGLGFATLLNFLGHNNKLAVWILTQPMAVLIAPLYPSGVAWADHYLKLSGIGMTVLISGASLGGAIYLWIIGYLYPRYGPRTFLYMLEAYSVSACICVCLLTLAGCFYGDRFKNQQKAGEIESKKSDPKNQRDVKTCKTYKAGGFLVDRFKRKGDIFIALGLLGGAAVTIGVPWMTTFVTMWLLMFCQGTFEGIINIAGQEIILLLWGEKSAGPMHLLHFGFGMGSFLNPLIAQPFLATRVVTNNTAFDNFTSDDPTATSPGTANITQTVTLVGSRIEYAYLIVAIFIALFSSTFYWFQFKGVPHGAYAEDLVEKPKKDLDVKGCKRYINLIDPATCAGGKRLAGFGLFFLLFLYFGQAVGGERIYSKFIRNFGLDQLGLTSTEATYLNSSFWISFSAGRFLGFIVATFVPIRFLIVIECFAGLGFATLLNFLGHNNTLALWVLTQPMSVLIAPLYPSGVAWGDHYLIMSGIGMTILIAGGSLGGVAYIWILGYIYPRYGPRTFLYMVEAYSVSVCICVCLLSVAGCLHGDRFKKMRMEEEFESELDGQTKVKNTSSTKL